MATLHERPTDRLVEYMLTHYPDEVRASRENQTDEPIVWQSYSTVEDDG